MLNPTYLLKRKNCGNHVVQDAHGEEGADTERGTNATNPFGA